MNMNSKSNCSVEFLFLFSSPVIATDNSVSLVLWSILLVAFVIALLILWLAVQTKNVIRGYLTSKIEPSSQDYEKYLTNLESDEIQVLLDVQNKSGLGKPPGQIAAVILVSSLLAPFTSHAQANGAL